MSDYTNTFGGAAHDTAEDTIQGVDFDTQFDAVATMSASKANKKVPATTSNLATLSATGDLTDSLETVATMKSYAKRGAIYLDAATTSSTISFSGTTISRTAGTIDLSVFKKGDVITITGTTLNNTSYTLASDASASSITTTASTTAESGQVPVFTTEGVVEVLDEDDMATDSASSVPSQQSAKAYADSIAATEADAVPRWTYIETLNLSGLTTSSGTYTGVKALRFCVEDAGGGNLNDDCYFELSSGGFSASGATGAGRELGSTDTITYASGRAYWQVNSSGGNDGIIEVMMGDTNTIWFVSGKVVDGTNLQITDGKIVTAGEVDAIRFGVGSGTWGGTTKQVHIWAYL